MTAFTLQNRPTNLGSSTLTFLSISAIVIILQLTIMVMAQMQVPEETTPPAKITEAVTNHSQIWQAYLELIGRQDRSSSTLTNPGLRQKIIANWGTKIAAVIDQQITKPDHPIYRQSEDVGLTRTELNANRLMAIAARGVT